MDRHIEIKKKTNIFILEKGNLTFFYIKLEKINDRIRL